ncbi:DUF2484 family protein [Rhodobacteraceae bacterium N5(2021)]|uniref:DUF2484 family protein n=1 Tax=Gymnodinialimonas phycosphaerae TaxID=2841589 RepID=A0A975TX65_9RHOB|nr:DUF2484 family protein [Gymnodinialimonas phycosphaerae]MBY4892607.1 DUF2484 family protein [Gymnodinialimonas phycosphaerae]
MSLALTLACIWAVASAFVAMMPMRFQWPLGFPLLVASIPMVGFVGYTHGWIWTLVVLAAILSMFRNPLRYFARRILGRAT